MIFCKQVIFLIIVRFNSGGSRGRVRGVWNPLSDLVLVWDRNSYILTLFHRLIFLMKCTLHFATKLNSRVLKNKILLFLAFSGLWRISDERLSELALIHLHHDLDIDEICTITRGECSKGASFMSRIQIHSKGPRNNVQLWLLGGGCGGEVICHKKSSFFFSMATSDWTKKKQKWPSEKTLTTILVIIYMHLLFWNMSYGQNILKGIQSDGVY